MTEEAIGAAGKPCPYCKKLVMRISGCLHMTCNCGHEFCYHCLGPYGQPDPSYPVTNPYTGKTKPGKCMAWECKTGYKEQEPGTEKA